ncbi:VOC family protein [Nocardioides tweenelious]
MPEESGSIGRVTEPVEERGWVVLADPEGNEFCVLPRRHQPPAT